MQFSETDTKLQNVMQELEKIFYQFKKIDIFKAVSNAYKKLKPFFPTLSKTEMEKIKILAIADLSEG